MNSRKQRRISNERFLMTTQFAADWSATDAVVAIPKELRVMDFQKMAMA
jgi:hypothetical protein